MITLKMHSKASNEQSSQGAQLYRYYTKQIRQHLFRSTKPDPFDPYSSVIERLNVLVKQGARQPTFRNLKQAPRGAQTPALQRGVFNFRKNLFNSDLIRSSQNEPNTPLRLKEDEKPGLGENKRPPMLGELRPQF